MDKDMLANELYLMDKGVRDCCETTIGGTPTEIGEKLYDIESMCLDYKYHVVSFLLEKEEDREYRSVFICKYNYQKILLTKLFNEVKPHSFVYEYILGTLLGYSAASMEEFLMRKHTDEFTSITQYNKEEEASPIKNQHSEFDKDAWQVLMSLNDNCAPDSEKINTLTDLLYTDTNDSREKDLVHELSTAVSLIDVNNPNFSLCIRILEKYFHVDTEDAAEDKEETNTSSADENKVPFFDNDLLNLLDGFRSCPSRSLINLEATKEFINDYEGKFESRSDAWKLIRDLRSTLLCLSTPAQKSETISNLLEKFYAKYHTEEKLDVEQYFEHAADLYTYLNVPTFSEESELAHIKKFIELTPPSYIPEQILYSKIKYDYYKLPSQEEKIYAVKDALHTYMLCKREAMDDEVETDNNTNESIDPYKQLVNKLYSDLRHAVSDIEFVSILNKFLEKDACYKGDAAFQKSLKWEIDNEYGKSKCFRFNVTKKIAEYLRR